jgi:hypothetical protein
MLETIVVAIALWLVFCRRPDESDGNIEHPARCFRPYGCRWPHCTCYQHQHQE